MGNSKSQNSKSPAVMEAGEKLIIQIRSRTIFIHYGYKMSMHIGDVGVFPHGLSGLKSWESNVVLSRFVVLKNQQFKNKKVLQINAGVGIAGIATSLWTKCKSISMCDTRQQVLKNLTKNCEKNLLKDIVVFRLNLAQYRHFTNKYDIILCNELLKPGVSYPQLYQALIYFLEPIQGSTIYMVMMDNKEEVEKFFECVESKEFEFKYEKLLEEEYYASPLPNKVEGFSEFPKLQKQDFYVLSLRRKFTEIKQVSQPTVPTIIQQQKQQKIPQNNLQQIVSPVKLKSAQKANQHQKTQKPQLPVFTLSQKQEKQIPLDQQIPSNQQPIKQNPIESQQVKQQEQANISDPVPQPIKQQQKQPEQQSIQPNVEQEKQIAQVSQPELQQKTEEHQTVSNHQSQQVPTQSSVEQQHPIQQHQQNVIQQRLDNQVVQQQAQVISQQQVPQQTLEQKTVVEQTAQHPQNEDKSVHVIQITTEGVKTQHQQLEQSGHQNIQHKQTAQQDNEPIHNEAEHSHENNQPVQTEQSNQVNQTNEPTQPIISNEPIQNEQIKTQTQTQQSIQKTQDNDLQVQKGQKVQQKQQQDKTAGKKKKNKKKR